MTESAHDEYAARASSVNPAPATAAAPAADADADLLVQVRDAARSFGAVQALSGVDLTLRRGECIGVVGHNGAGKSTLMNVLCGTLAPDRGELRVGGEQVGGVHAAGTSASVRWSVREAQRRGLRCVFQELSLCSNLTLAENMRLVLPRLRGVGWRARAGALLVTSLDRIFPGHGLRADQPVGELPIGKRQMVEIARAFTPGELPLEVMILDEPTSSLDGQAAQQLLAFIRRFVAQGKGCVLISHKLGEVFQATDRVLVMRDGKVVHTARTAATDRERVVAAMGQDEHGSGRGLAADAAAGSADSADAAGGRGTAPVVVTVGGATPLRARRGEVIGLAGLAGHGQTELLLRVQDAAGHARGPAGGAIEVDGAAAFVAGDRQTDGVLNLWSIQRNMSVGWLAQLRRRGFIDLRAEAAAAQTWRERLGLVTPDVNLPIQSLSGGNQQKALFARAIGSAARIILMDDPMRGVDVGTKHDVYGLIAGEAKAGRTFLWYTTEFDELFHCDRICVFNSGRVVGELARAELSEERVLSLSFQEAGA